ncbi:MAG: PD-(D/E)XK nuclease family protein [bacterium]|nr:PD-(D/E)XK nuclease family protein [bacterium]
MNGKGKNGEKRIVAKRKKAPIKHWSHSSLMAFLRNPLAWYKRYVEEIYDNPRTPASIVGSAGHKALEHFYRQVSENQVIALESLGRANAGGKTSSEYFLKKSYSGAPKDIAIQKGLEYVRNIADFEIDFGRAKTRMAKKKKRALMEAEYLRAISYYLARPPKHKVLGVEVRGIVEIEGLPLPIKAISDLVVESKIQKGAVDIVDHKFVASFSKGGAAKSLFVIQAIFNYYTVREMFGKPVRRFIVYECKKTKNADGSPQMRRYIIDFKERREDFKVFYRLVNDATEEISRQRKYLPNPSDMFEGDNSFDIYRLELVDDD